MQAPFRLNDFFDKREDERRAFADAHGYRGFSLNPLYEDMASRRFFRLTSDGRSAVLMDSLPDDHPQATKGHKIHDYLRIGRALREKGLQVPEIFAADEKAGFVLMEDLGDTPIGEAGLAIATDALILLQGTYRDNVLELPDYFSTHIHAAHRRVVDWYMPCALQEKNPDDWTGEYSALWSEIERTLPPPPVGFVHADFHRGNLRFAKGGCGILDFQGAVWGPPLYDLVNLLEDGRVRTGDTQKQFLKEKYRLALPLDQQHIFDPWYDILSVQFHCRLAGQFIKLALSGGKNRYLQYIPVVQSYLQAELNNPALVSLKLWFAQKGIDFSETPLPHALYIRPDAV